MENVRFSIIIPVYNVEAYIEECINSVLQQTYTNIEIILVDDGSTDKSGEICNAYEQNDQRISVIHKSNGGLSDARNAGIENASGEYLIFLDSDDYWCESDFLYNINEIISNTDADLIQFGVSKFFEKNGIMSCRNYNGYENSTINTMLKENFYKACACDKIVKKSIIDFYKMKFKKGYYSEDIDWCTKLLAYCKNIYFYNKPVYVYRQRQGSITSDVKFKHIEDIMKLCQSSISFIEEHDGEKQNLYNYLSYEYCVALGLIGAYRGNDKKALLEYTNNLDQLLKYDLNKKVKKSKILVRVFGKNVAIFSLGLLIRIKKIKRR